MNTEVYFRSIVEQAAPELLIIETQSPELWRELRDEYLQQASNEVKPKKRDHLRLCI